MKRKIKRAVLYIFRKPLNLGLLILFVSTSFLLLNVALTKWDTKDSIDDESRTLEESEASKLVVPEGIRDWEYYVHPEYNFSVYVPRLLVKREYDDSGDYLFFVRFEENRFSENGGVAVGVSDRTPEEEETKIREILGAEFPGLNPEKETVKLTSGNAIRLDYRAGDVNEPRTIVLVRNGEYTYSISTVPEQIDNVLAGFVMLE